MTVTDTPAETTPTTRGRRPGPRLVAVGVVAVLALLAAVYVAGWTSLMGVRTVQVEGQGSLTADELVAAAGIAQGTPMMRVDLRAATARIADLPQVASVDVRRQWPRTIVVEVTQRDAVAVRKAADGWELLDANGSAFAIAPSKPKDLPVVAAAPEPATETAMLQALAGMTPEIRAQVAEVAAVSPTAIRLTLRKGQAVVNWGSAEDAAFKSQVLAVLLGTKAGWYDVSNPQTPTTADAPPQPATPSAAPSDPAATAQPTASPVAPSPTVAASPEAAVSPLGVVTD